ncbi:MULTISPECIES: hypothetical protein [Lysinibacillus]|uniref:hypothetical protein n=1 Tax=Lysinibacillus TaxID=400634 RepID=UPI00214BCCF1|nr:MULTISPECIES: hypothetical protein [Lysinibacillus]UUV25894.1 hypothetical protein NP781_04560 [Lysinibacillus sp. FN11]UYB48767.1 hypothetical protein OCI51_07350 [Lysinibacillus capsici]
MVKFEKYDKVELNKDLKDYDLLEGETGMIMGYNEEDELYAVRFDFDDEDEDLLHDCNGLVKDNKGLWLDDSVLRKRW